LPTILRPGPSTHTLVYRANPRGQFSFTAAVNGASIRFLVDTGANLVMLTPEDARAAGIDPSALVFNSRAITANGVVRIAPVMLGEIRIEQLSMRCCRGSGTKSQTIAAWHEFPATPEELRDAGGWADDQLVKACRSANGTGGDRVSGSGLPFVSGSRRAVRVRE
jgi:clan AA aspartic protease (TIGR02281 family)